MEDIADNEEPGNTFDGKTSEIPVTQSDIYQQSNQVLYVNRSPVPIIIGAIYSLFQIFGVLGSLAIILGGALLTGFSAEADVEQGFGIGVVVLGVISLTLSSAGVYAGILMIQYKKRGINIALALLLIGFLMNIPMNLAMGDSVLNGLGLSFVTNGICGAIVAIPLLASSIGDQME